MSLLKINIIISSRRPSAWFVCMWTTHSVICPLPFLMFWLGHCTIPKQIIGPITAAPTIIIIEGALFDSSTFVAQLIIRQLLGDRREFCHGCHKFCCDGGKIFHLLYICGDEVGHLNAIGGVGGCKVGDRIDGFNVIFGMIWRWSRCYMKTWGHKGIHLALPVLLEGMVELKFELRPCFVWGRAALPNEKLFGEDDILEKQLVQCIDYMIGGVPSSSRVCKIYGVLNLTKQAFNKVVDVKFCLQSVIFFW